MFNNENRLYLSTLNLALKFMYIVLKNIILSKLTQYFTFSISGLLILNKSTIIYYKRFWTREGIKRLHSFRKKRVGLHDHNNNIIFCIGFGFKPTFIVVIKAKDSWSDRQGLFRKAGQRPCSESPWPGLFYTYKTVY